MTKAIIRKDAERERICLGVWEELKAIDKNMGRFVYPNRISDGLLVEWIAHHAKKNDFQDAMAIVYREIFRSRHYRLHGIPASAWISSYGEGGCHLLLGSYKSEWEELERETLELIKNKLSKNRRQ